jgi:hypothetical protein
MKFEKRILKLEKKLNTDPVILFFADGSTKELQGHSGFLLDLFCAYGRSDMTAAQFALGELIRQSVRSAEPGGARLIELIRALLHGPVTKPDRPLEAFL